MSNRRFLLRQEPMPSLDELATEGGVKGLSIGPWPDLEDDDVRYGRWGDVLSVKARVNHLSMYDCLALDFLQGSFLDLLSAMRANGSVPRPQ